MAFAKFTGVLIPSVSENVIWLSAGFFKLGPVQLLAIGSVLFLTWINTKGIKEGKKVQNIFTSGKVLLLILFILIGLIFASNSAAIQQNSSYFWNAQELKPDGQIAEVTGFGFIAVLGMAMVGSLFSSDAWNNVTFTAGEVINPKRNIPLSLFFGTLIVTVLYLLANLVYISALPLRGDPQGVDAASKGIQFALNERLATAAMTGVFGNYAVMIMAAFHFWLQ
jgi:APA family basic amino acid/polyamine antiporter